MIVQSLPTNPSAQATYALDNPPGIGRRFVQGLQEGLETTSLGLVASGDTLVEASLGKPISEDDWKQSEWYREGLTYTPGMTQDTAEILAHRKDRGQARAFAASQTGFAGTLADLAGNFIGSIPDPLNFIPMVGPAWRARAVAKLGPVAGTAATMALEAAGGAALLQPILASEMAAHQDPYDWEMAASNILIAAGIGGTLGAGVGRFSRVRTVDHVAATSKATADVIAGRPVDVSPIIGDQGRVLNPDTVRTPEQIKALDADYKRTVAQAAELDRQIASADPAMAETLRGTRDALMRQADEQAVELGSTVKPDMTVPPRVVSELPAVEPTTAANVYQPVAADEVDFSVTDRRYKELEAAGQLGEDTTRAMDAVAKDKETISAWSKAWEIAGTCLMGK